MYGIWRALSCNGCAAYQSAARCILLISCKFAVNKDIYYTSVLNQLAQICRLRKASHL